jgi:F5/8 type C domain
VTGRSKGPEIFGEVSAEVFPLSKAMINGTNCWKPKIQDSFFESFVFLYKQSVSIVELQTQGCPDGTAWVKSYTLDCYLDSVWSQVEGGKIFNANSDGGAIVSIKFPQPLICEIILLTPVSVENRVGLRMELIIIDN